VPAGGLASEGGVEPVTEEVSIPRQGRGKSPRFSEIKCFTREVVIVYILFSCNHIISQRGVSPMKKVLYLICALFVAVAFGSVALADQHEKKAAPTDNAVKTAPKDNAAKTPVKK
jgi:hypothetical protein